MSIVSYTSAAILPLCCRRGFDRLGGMASYGLKTIGLCVVAAAVMGLTALPVFGVSAQRAPDYAEATGNDWLYNHAIPAKRYAQEPKEDPGVDLFYFPPTCINSDSTAVEGICSIDNTTMRGTARNYWGATGELFGGFTHVYAPFYRQVILDKLSALCSQYKKWEANIRYSEYIRTHAGFEDACAALDHYFKVYNPGARRPFILSGASQGSALIYELLEYYFTKDETHKAYLKNLVAAYCIGYGLDHARMARIKANTASPGFEGVCPATNAVDSGVVVTWNTEALGNGDSVLLTKDASVVINPLLWTTNTVLAEKEMNLGARNFRTHEITAGLYDAQIDAKRGSVISRTMTKDMLTGYGGFGGASYHNYDTLAYWVNIQTNALMRIKTHLRKPFGMMLYCR